MNVDPYQLRNIYQTLSEDELNFMHSSLLTLKAQKGEQAVAGAEGEERTRKRSHKGRKRKHRKERQQQETSFNRIFGTLTLTWAKRLFVK
jgi:hypothetical protein